MRRSRDNKPRAWPVSARHKWGEESKGPVHVYLPLFTSPGGTSRLSHLSGSPPPTPLEQGRGPFAAAPGLAREWGLARAPGRAAEVPLGGEERLPATPRTHQSEAAAAGAGPQLAVAS